MATSADGGGPLLYWEGLPRPERPTKQRLVELRKDDMCSDSWEPVIGYLLYGPIGSAWDTVHDIFAMCTTEDTYELAAIGTNMIESLLSRTDANLLLPALDRRLLDEKTLRAFSTVSAGLVDAAVSETVNQIRLVRSGAAEQATWCFLSQQPERRQRRRARERARNS